MQSGDPFLTNEFSGKAWRKSLLLSKKDQVYGLKTGANQFA